MKHTSLYSITLATLLSAALLAGCRSSKKAMSEPDTTTGATTVVDSRDNNKTKKQKRQVVAHINANRQTAKGIRGKMEITVQANSTPITASGNIKMKRNEIIQLSLTALGLVEIGRLELTPEYLLIQDRYNKRYLKEKWEKIPALKDAGVDFYTFQAMFWNELYVPNSKAVPTEDDFDVKDMGAMVRLQPKDEPKVLDVMFYTNQEKDQVAQTSLVASKGKFRFDGNCKGWNKLDGKQFPTGLKLNISASRNYSLDLDFTRLQVDDSMGNVATSISEGRYKRVDIDSLLKGLHF